MTSGRVALVATLVLSHGAVSRQQQYGLERLAWLQGCWEASSPQRIVEEVWARCPGN